MDDGQKDADRWREIIDLKNRKLKELRLEIWGDRPTPEAAATPLRRHRDIDSVKTE